MKRLLSCAASDFAAMTPKELKAAIYASAGRTVMSETIVALPPLLLEVTNAETAAAFGADLILLNFYDALNPAIMGLPDGEGSPIARLKKLVGRPVGINLEPVGEGKAMEDIAPLPPGRTATADTFKAAQQQGADYILLTGNPGTGVTNDAIEQAVRLCRQHFEGLVIAGKMHSAGVDEDVLNPEAITRFISAGADIILLDIEKPHLYPQTDMVANLVYCAKASDVETVFVDGRKVVENRRLLTMNQAALCLEAQERFEAIKDRIG